MRADGGQRCAYVRAERGPGGPLALLFLLLAPGLAAPGRPASAQTPPVDTTGLGSGPHARMHTLLEKTIFRVDVLTLDVRFGPETTARLDSLVDARSYSERLADSVAAVALGTGDAWARIQFERSVSLDRFLGGIRDNLREARDAGIVTETQFGSISSNLPRWYAFLSDRKIHEGDEMFYGIRGDSLHSVFRGAEGEVLLDQVDVGPERRLSVLGGYFAPGSDFREGLIRSLFTESDRG